MSHFKFLLEYKIKIVFPSLGWGIIVQIIPCAARLVPDSVRLSFLEKKLYECPRFSFHYVKTPFYWTVNSPIFFSQISIGIYMT